MKWEYESSKKDIRGGSDFFFRLKLLLVEEFFRV